MRIIAGEFRSRKLKSLPGLETRPTPDRLRESLFNILAPRIEDAVFVDAYAGTGAVGIEALSRGARKAVFLERSRSALEILHENLRALDLEARSQVVLGRVAMLLAHYPADIVFLDPPYAQAKEYDVIMEELSRIVPPLAVVQHGPRQKLLDEYGRLRRTRVVRQGDNHLSFYEPAP
jgi:16S rRNA (guanine966-N2)-methyltransferase